MEPISRNQVIERLRAVDLGGGSHESLSAIAKAVYEPAGGWTIVACEALRQTLVRLLGGDAMQDRSITDELPDLLRKAAKGDYEGTSGDVIENIAQLIGCKSHMAHIVIAELADKVEQALSASYTKGHLSGFDEADRLTHDAAALQIENAKLWELCERFAEYVSQDRCEGCVCKHRCDNGDIDECWQRTEIREAAHELGIEVD